MGKLLDSLNRQLKTEFKSDAEECITVYERLKELHNGHVWSSVWDPLVNTRFDGKYPNAIRIYKLTNLGRLYYDSINKSTTEMDKETLDKIQKDYESIQIKGGSNPMPELSKLAEKYNLTLDNLLGIIKF